MSLTLKPKITLKAKESVAIDGGMKQMIVKLQWNNPVDLDLIACIEKKDGSQTAVFSDQISKNVASLGDLNSFPFIQLSGDDMGTSSAAKEETLIVNKIAPEVSKIHIIALNYTDASTGKSNTFSNYDGKVSVTDDKGNNFEVPLQATEPGIAAHICSIDNTSPIGAKLERIDSVMSLNQLESFPGAKALFA